MLNNFQFFNVKTFKSEGGNKWQELKLERQVK